MAPPQLGQNVEDPNSAQRNFHHQFPRGGHIDQAPVREMYPMGTNNFNHLTTMNWTKAVVPTMPDNIRRIVEYTGVLMRMFSIQTRAIYLDITGESVEELPKEDL